MAVVTVEKQVADRERRGVGTATVERLKLAGPDVESIDGIQLLEDWSFRQCYRRGLLRRPNEGKELAEQRYDIGWRLKELKHRGGLFPLGSRDYSKPFGVGDGVGAIYPQEWQEKHRQNYREAVAELGRAGTPGKVVLLIVLDDWEPEFVGKKILGRADKRTGATAVSEQLIEGLETLGRFWRLTVDG